ncbi:hypothetical protein B0H16DRAFT_310128 [Mycena metata]|uniref:Uncharacterized protein n=1 Tax=Mycena metata TaxID=1033252 RepID=A0AAD7NMY4_9AGAR|nr:hypothetical protein B0H16DRAFT_310128 [Mycena metata]
MATAATAAAAVEAALAGAAAATAATATAAMATAAMATAAMATAAMATGATAAAAVEAALAGAAAAAAEVMVQSARLRPLDMRTITPISPALLRCGPLASILPMVLSSARKAARTCAIRLPAVYMPTISTTSTLVQKKTRATC